MKPEGFNIRYSSVKPSTEGGTNNVRLQVSVVGFARLMPASFADGACPRPGETEGFISMKPKVSLP
jgi:hypothetical protein